MFHNIPKKYKILILGSYHPQNYLYLNELCTFLKKKGFLNTFLARELVKTKHISEFDHNIPKMEFIFTEIEKLMNKADFLLFVFFEDYNESVIVELTSVLKTKNFKDNQTVALIPNNYNISMLEGLISQQKLNVFRYYSFSEILEYSKNFILRNILTG